MSLDEKKIQDILTKQNYVPSEELSKAVKYAKTRRIPLVEYLISKGLVTRDLLGQAISESYGVPYADINSNPPSREQVKKIPEETAKKFRIVIYKDEWKSVNIATDDPMRDGLIRQLTDLFPGRRITVSFALSEDIDGAFIHYRKALETRFADILKSEQKVAPEIIGQILDDAFVYHASDIHFEPQEKEVVIRFRIDGVLHEAGIIPKELYENILNRIKVMAHMRIDEHYSAQDGAVRYERGEGHSDMRVSVAPTVDGEKTVIRILSEYVRGFTLADLGLSSADQEKMESASRKPFGMILITGPTGSGKTTTLYALVKILSSPEVNITTIEDPVEYKITGISQIQVNPATNLTFAKGLKSIARQDPDIILVGEIRDRETAEIAVNAALTGHLLLSTFHANDAATGVPRLLDMGVEPFLLASTLELIVAQRLVRKVCDICRYSRQATEEELKRLPSSVIAALGAKSPTLYYGKGCTACGHTGYRGRSAIFELISITQEMKDLFLKSPTTNQIWQLAVKQGSRTLFDDGMDKVKNGMTTLEELLRVVAVPN